MDAFNQTWIWAIFGSVVILGIILTIVYYFSRYYLKTHKEDKEVFLREAQEVVKAPEVQPVLEKAVERITEISPPKPKELREALSKTRDGFWGRMKGLFQVQANWNLTEFDDLEEILYTSDLGPKTVQRLIESISTSVRSSKSQQVEELRTALKEEMHSIFENSHLGIKTLSERIAQEGHKPFVILIVGVNGAGKTTTIGKLAHLFSEQGLATMVVAGDTFRAAAREQLNIWSNRANVEIFNSENVKDPSAMAYEGCQQALAKKVDVVLVDTAGRLHTQVHLMEELKKIKRVMQKVIPEAPHESLIVLDANSGQNALLQAKMFHEALGLTGAILTKLDGTAKGGVALGLAYELQLPIRMIGVGEGVSDLRVFDSTEFVDSIL